MTEPRRLPKDIEPAKGLPKVLGACLILFAALLAYPPLSALIRGGLERFGHWPDMFNFFALGAAVLGGSGVYLIVKPFETGSAVRFHDGGFTIHVRRAASEEVRRFEWAEVSEFGQTSWSNNTGYFLRLRTGREFPYNSVGFKASRRVFLESLVASATAAGYRCEKTRVNLFLYEKDKWTVHPDHGKDDAPPAS